MRSLCTSCILEQGLSLGKPSVFSFVFGPAGARARSVPGARRGSGVGRPDAGRTPASLRRAAGRGWFPKGFSLAPAGEESLPLRRSLK